MSSPVAATGVDGCGEYGLLRLLSAIGEKFAAAALYLYGPSPEECLLLHSLPWAELCLDRLKGMGVPCGEMKGVLHSETEPNVAAREMSDDEEL